MMITRLPSSLTHRMAAITQVPTALHLIRSLLGFNSQVPCFLPGVVGNALTAGTDQNWLVVWNMVYFSIYWE